jgi:peroxiredoxin
MRALLVLAAVAALAGGGCSANHNVVDQTSGSQNRYVAGGGTSQTFPVGKRRMAPGVSGELLDGGSFDVAAHKGQVVVLNFWASWCPPCRDEAPELEAAYQATKADGVTFVGVDGRDTKDAARQFVEGHGLTYPSLFDPPGQVAMSFREVPVSTLPSTMVIDREGKIAAVFRQPVFRDDLTPLLRQIGAR